MKDLKLHFFVHLILVQIYCHTKKADSMARHWLLPFMCCQEKQEKSTETLISNEQLRTKTKHSLSFFVGETNADKCFFVPGKVRVKISFYYRRHYKRK
jgi:hypothetical protein